MFGVDRFDAILPPGQGAIMAVGAAVETLVASNDGTFGIKKQMQVGKRVRTMASSGTARMQALAAEFQANDCC